MKFNWNELKGVDQELQESYFTHLTADEPKKEESEEPKEEPVKEEPKTERKETQDRWEDGDRTHVDYWDGSYFSKGEEQE